jgi:hypothetical protein
MKTKNSASSRSQKEVYKAALFSTIYEQDTHGRLWELASIKVRLTTQKSENKIIKRGSDRA